MFSYSMKNSRTPSSTGGELLRWQFARGGQQITCAVLARGRRTFDVMTLPHGHLRDAAIETFRAATDALGRHAAIAAQLRSHGWAVTAYTS